MRTYTKFMLLLVTFIFAASAVALGYASPRVNVPQSRAYNYEILSDKHAATGVQRALVVLVEFQDVKHVKTPEEIRSTALDRLNAYYREISYGKVSISGDVYGWYTLSNTMSFYGHDSLAGKDTNVEVLGRDALLALPQNVTGKYDFLVIVHAGEDQAFDPQNPDDIWSSCICSVFPNYRHESPLTEGRLSFGDYAFLSEFNGFGTFAHEWGHYFGYQIYMMPSRRSLTLVTGP